MTGQTGLRFHIPPLSHTRFFGAHLAAHCLQDSLCFLYGGEGCKTKTQAHLVFHDWSTESHNRRIWTDLRDAHYIEGTADRMESVVKTWIERKNPSIVYIVSVAFIEASGEDIGAAVRRLSDWAECPVIWLPSAGFSGDLFAGYGSAVFEAMRAVDWSRGAVGGVNIVGHFMDRLEMDRRADVSEMVGLLNLLGVPVHAVFLGGQPFSDLRSQAWKATHNLVLPYAGGQSSLLAEVSGRVSIDVDLPLGLAGTTRFVESVGRALGLSDELVRAVVDREMLRVVPMIEAFVDRLGEADSGRRVAIFSDTPLAAGLAALCADCQFEVAVVGLTDRSLGGADAFSAAFGRLSPAGLGQAQVFEVRSRNQVVDAVGALGQMPDVVFGSSIELLDLKDLGVRGIEVGFPSYLRHGVHPLPLLGYSGATSLVQRIQQAITVVF